MDFYGDIMKDKFINRFLKNKNSILYSWSVSYIYIILIFIAVFLVISFVSSAMYKKQIEKSNEYIIEHTQSLLDGVFEGIEKTSSTIWLDSDVVSLFKIGDTISDSQYAAINEVIKKIKRAQASNENISDLSIVDAEHNRVYTTGGVVDIPTYYEFAFSGNKDMSYDDFVGILNSTYSEIYLMTSFGGALYKNIDEISYIRGFGYSGKDNLNQSLIVSVRAETFLEQMKSIKNIGMGSEIYIVNSDGKLMVSTGGELYNSIDVSSFTNGRGSFDLKYDSKKYTVQYEKSNQGDWYYITANPKSQSVMKVVIFQLLFSIGFIIVLILAFLYMHRFINKNYGPLFVILNMLGKKDNPDTPMNEFEVIAAGIQDMLAANKNLDKRIYDQNRILRNTFFEKLCRGYIDDDPGVISDNLYMYDIKFTGNKFLAMVIFLEEETENTGSDVYSFMQIVFIISNVMEELIAQKHYGVLFECDSVISGIINVNENHQDTLKKDMEEAVSNAQDFIFNNFGIKFTAAFSSVFENIENSNKGYDEAISTMKYKKTMGIDETKFYDDIKNMNSSGYYYPFDVEHQLSNLIRTANADEAKKLIDSIIDENLKNKQLSPDLAKYLMFNITSTVIRTMNEMAMENSGEILMDSDIINEISHTDSIKEMKDNIYKLIDKIEGVSGKMAGMKNNWIMTGVIPFIEKNYTDCSLSVSMIANNFGMHPVYTSRLFKEQTGIGLFEYISKYRIDKAKEILINTDYTLEKVAEEVGYATSRTFSRMFKKTEGITPGKYREMHHK